MFNIYLGIYIVVSIFVVAGGSLQLYNTNQLITALLYFIGTLTIFVMFGLKWFGSDKSIFSNAPVSWPPTLNSCPDYLTYYARKMPDGTVQDTCIDLIGVSKNSTLKVFPKDVAPPNNEDYYFPLSTKSSDTSLKNMELCQRAMTFGLTWEGITNGESCISPNGSTVAPGSSGSAGTSGCPAL
jgi:hypothetical protein